ncbi:MAG: PEP-utilizing enzyme [Nannocystaceae bacterium]
MSAPLPWLHAVDHATLPAKAGRLAALAQAGLPVPRGFVVSPSPSALDDPRLARAVEQMLRDGPLVVRSALAGEDEAEGSAAGLGRSVLDCTTLAAVRAALAPRSRKREDPWLVAYRRDAPSGVSDHAIIQRQIDRRVLLVVAVPPQAGAEIEVHSSAGEALAEGRHPDFAGPLDAWPDPARAPVFALVERTMAAVPPSPHGYDLEVVVAADGHAHLVQARPLTTPLHPGWPAFHDAIAQQGQLSALHGTLTLDAEHNPAPLSPAHAWLMDWLRVQRPRAGDPTVLAGWLYVRTLPRDLARASTSTRTSPSRPALPTALQTIAHLHGDTLPRARDRLRSISNRLEAATTPVTIAASLPLAQAAFLAMIDAYVGVLVPARTRARRAAGNTMAADPSAPLSTRGRDEFLDVLPATWDLASPSLAELGTRPTEHALRLPTTEAQAATLLGEWDDHLFALGLAPLRAWFLAAGDRLELRDDVFMLTAPEVLAALHGSTEDLTVRISQRRDRQRQRAALRPPLRIEDGRPVSFGRRARLRGIPIGPSFTGCLAPRDDLSALLVDPPGPDAIVILPSLTAPAAVALQQLGIRAVCCEHGGPLSHAALMARELGLSALIGCRGCTELPAGRRARLDTTVGRLVVAD